MANIDSPPVTLHVDPEHGGLRAVVALSMFVGAALGFALIRQMLGFFNDGYPDYTFLVSCVGGLIVSISTIWVMERILKSTWHSGQKIELNDRGMTLINRVENDMHLKWRSDLAQRHWTFKLSGFSRAARETRVPKSWICLASMIQKDDKRLILFTYMPSGRGREFLEGLGEPFGFFEIDPRDVYESANRIRMGPPMRPTIPATVLSGPNGRFWQAEKRRWDDGLELTPDDYETFISFLNQFSEKTTA